MEEIGIELDRIEAQNEKNRPNASANPQEGLYLIVRALVAVGRALVAIENNQ